MEIEKLYHLFCKYIHVQHSWSDLSILLQDYNAFIQFNLRYILLGLTEGTNRTEIQLKTL